MMEVYHGTSYSSAISILESGIDLTAGRKNMDFGRGFYTTKDYYQAERWAKRKSFYRNNDSMAVLAFYCNEETLNSLIFHERDKRWFDYIFSNRVYGKDLYPFYDYIEGDMADGNIKLETSDLLAGKINASEYKRRISKPIGSQIVFKTKKGIESLKFKYIVGKEDEK